MQAAIRSCRRRALQLLVPGALLAGAGLSVTALTYFAGLPHEGQYLIWLPPLVVGGLMLLVGLWELLRIGGWETRDGRLAGDKRR